MNEPRCDVTLRETCEDDMHDWIEDMSAFLKMIDPYHMVSIGEEVGRFHMLVLD
jgi:endo-1,4-beta-mannosidase